MSSATPGEKLLASVGGIVLGIPVMLLLALPLTLFWAWAFVTLWGWFIVPLGLPMLSYPQAMGISCLRGLFSGSAGVKDEYLNPWWHRLGLQIGAVLFAVVIGWIVKAVWL